MSHLFRGRGARALPKLVLAASIALSASACETDKLVKVSDPGSLRPEDLQTLGSVPALVNGAFRQFIGGYAGFGDDSFLSSSAVITDEWYYGDTFTTRDAADRRQLQPTILGNISNASFTRLQQARFNARRAVGVVDQFTTPLTAKADSATKAQLRAIEAYVYVTFSEGFCGNVPFSTLPDVGPIDPLAIKGGVGLTTQQMNDTAVARFTEALQQNPTNRLAAVGLGRALLNLGRFSEAAAAVAAVPTNYVFLIQHSTNTGAENNPVNALMANGRYGIASLEGGLTPSGAAIRADTASVLTAASAEGLNFRSAVDIRVLWERRGNSPFSCFDATARCTISDNYPNLDADMPLASGVEARLIEAEAALNAPVPDVVTFLAKLNALRTNPSGVLNVLYPNRVIPDSVLLQPFAAGRSFRTAGAENGLAPLVDPGTPDARRDLLFRERAFWMYNTGHRQGDLRRLARAPYNLPTASVFPSGPYWRGGVYGDDVAYPVPFNEANNPNYNPDLCDTKKP